MFPGGRMNERQMKVMMKRAGINTEEIEDVEEVLVRTKGKDYHFKPAVVTIIHAQGQTMYQLMGEPKLYKRGEAPMAGANAGSSAQAPAGITISDDDVALVAEKAGVSDEEARKALEECDGQPAEAIIKLMSR